MRQSPNSKRQRRNRQRPHRQQRRHLPAAPSANAVTAPMVGTVYLSPAPGAKPFVEIGQTVKEGQTILIIEAMKTMNQIPSPRSGKVVDVLVGDGHPVEFAEPMIVIE
jgi:acetyl-CoA carboxylase biotin carboxyl carrier protein